MTPQKVITWGTGFVGKQIIRELAPHPAFDLVGVIVNDPEKDGLDAGEIAGIGRIGVIASTNAKAVLAQEADAVAYFGPTAQYARENIDNMCLAMQAGKDVVSTAMTPFVYPKVCPPDMLKGIEQVCQETGKSCFTTGIDPGFANDLIPLTLMGVCGRADTRADPGDPGLLHLRRRLRGADGARGADGLPGDARAFEKVLIFSWGRHRADDRGRGRRRSSTRSIRSTRSGPRPERIEFPLGSPSRPGNCAAIRFEIRGWVNGEPRIVVEHCNRLTTAAAPHWPRPKMMEDDAYRVIIEGSPNIEQETAFRGRYDGDANSGGCLSTGMRAIHAIPAVVAARPGLVTALDLPLIPGAGNMHLEGIA